MTNRSSSRVPKGVAIYLNRLLHYVRNDRKIETLILILIIVLALVLRLYKIHSPLADWHSFRQADTAAVARNFIKEGFDPLFPQSDSLTVLNETQIPNPKRYFINEFPFYNSVVALIYHYRGIDPSYGRLVSAIFAVIGTFFLYLIARRLFDVKVALLSTFYYAILPYNVYYGRVFMPDPTFVSLSIISLYLFLLLVDQPTWLKGFLFSFVFALALLVKPYAIFMVIPFIFWVFQKYKFGTFSKLSIVIPSLLSLVPLLLWRYHISLHPEGAFASNWLLNGGNIRFKGAFFRWLIYDRLNRLIFATGGFVLFFFGLVNSVKKRNGLLVFTWIISVLAYFTVFAKGNVTHDYYQLPIMPPGAILVSLGFFYLISLGSNQIQKYFYTILGGTLLVISIAFGWYEVRDFYNINNPAIIEAGNRIDQLTPKDALIVAPYQTDPAFLYQTNRHGWTTGDNIPQKIKDGADYYVSTSYDTEARDLEKIYKVVEKTDHYIIIDLTAKK